MNLFLFLATNVSHQRTTVSNLTKAVHLSQDCFMHIDAVCTNLMLSYTFLPLLLLVYCVYIQQPFCLSNLFKFCPQQQPCLLVNCVVFLNSHTLHSGLQFYVRVRCIDFSSCSQRQQKVSSVTLACNFIKQQHTVAAFPITGESRTIRHPQN